MRKKNTVRERGGPGNGIKTDRGYSMDSKMVEGTILGSAAGQNSYSVIAVHTQVFHFGIYLSILKLTL